MILSQLSSRFSQSEIRSMTAECTRLGGINMAQGVCDLEVPAERINIKATTCEQLGALGRSEGLACHAIVLLAYAHGGQHGS
jgi:hypothetical protein